MKFSNIALIALLSTSTMMAGFDELKDDVATGAVGTTETQEDSSSSNENTSSSTIGSQLDNATLTAENNQRNSDVRQSGLVNVNENGTITIGKGTSLNGATVTSRNNQRNSDVRQSGLVNVNRNGVVTIK